LWKPIAIFSFVQLYVDLEPRSLALRLPAFNNESPVTRPLSPLITEEEKVDDILLPEVV